MSTEGSVVIINYHGKPAMYARIEAIEPDIKRGWYRITFLLLTIPPKPVTWILREEYINGADFTMGGVPMTIKEVGKTAGHQNNAPPKGSGPGTGKEELKPGRVIPFKKGK